MNIASRNRLYRSTGFFSAGALFTLLIVYFFYLYSKDQVAAAQRTGA